MALLPRLPGEVPNCRKGNVGLKHFLRSVLVLSIVTGGLSAQSRSTAVPLLYPLFEETGLPICGIGHFLRKDYVDGSFFALTEGATYILSQSLSSNMKRDTTAYPCVSTRSVVYRREARGLSPREFASYQLAGYMFQTYYNLRLADAFTTYRDYRAEEPHTIPTTRESAFSLLASPLDWKYIQEPAVFLPALAAAGASFLGSEHNPSMLDARTLNWFGLNVSPAEATIGSTTLEAFGFALLSVAEEGFFRGVLQTELSERVSPDFGLIASSILFGAAHYPVHGLSYSIRAAVAGAYLGWQYKDSHYDLGRCVAIHFYIDFLPAIIDLFRNPVQARGVYTVGCE